MVQKAETVNVGPKLPIDNDDGRVGLLEIIDMELTRSHPERLCTASQSDWDAEITVAARALTDRLRSHN